MNTDDKLLAELYDLILNHEEVLSAYYLAHSHHSGYDVDPDTATEYKLTEADLSQIKEATESLKAVFERCFNHRL